VTNQPSDMVRAMVLRELEEGKRHDGLWLQAMSESKLDKEKAQLRYIALRSASLQNDVKGLLIKQIRRSIVQDERKPSNADLASFLAAKTQSPVKK